MSNEATVQSSNDSKRVQKFGARYYPCPHCHHDHPSVTTLLDVISSPALMGWSAKNGTAKLNLFTKIAEPYIEEELFSKIKGEAENEWKKKESTMFWKSGKESAQDAADSGTNIHACIEAHLHGVSIDLAGLSDPVRQAFEAFLSWYKANKIEVIATEKIFYNCEMDYAGTADAVLKINDELTLVDWKSSTGIFSNYPIQVWAYALADELSNSERLYKQIAIGRFGKDGASEIKVFPRNGFPGIEDARDMMRACKTIFEFKNEWETRFPYKRSK